MGENGAEIAQLVERGTENPGVPSSILGLGTIYFDCVLSRVPRAPQVLRGRKERTMEDATCAVCGKLADVKEFYTKVEHRGRIYYICCPICLQLFQMKRDRYTRGKTDDNIR